MCLQLVLPVLTIVLLFALLITLLALVSRRCSACPQPAARAPGRTLSVGVRPAAVAESAVGVSRSTLTGSLSMAAAMVSA